MIIIIIITAWIKNKKEEDKEHLAYFNYFIIKSLLIWNLFFFSSDFLCLIVINAHFNLGRTTKRERF